MFMTVHRAPGTVRSMTLHTANFQRWGDAVAAGNAVEVAALYHDRFTLLPTMARDVIHERNACEAYFTFFCSLHPTVRMVEEHIEKLGSDAYLQCGVYRFTLDQQGARADIDARFSMVWQRVGDTWQILHHHSSRIPTL